MGSENSGLKGGENAILSSDKDKLSNRNLFGFSLGGIGRDMTYTLFNSFLFTYILFTRHLDSAQFAAVNIIMIFARVFDAVIDPFIASLVDGTRGKYGKFKPWIMIGAVTAAVVVILGFSTPLTGWSFVGFVAAIYVGFSMTYSLNDISYWSMIPALTPKGGKDRDKLMSIAVLCASAGGAIVTVLVPNFTTSNPLGGSANSAYMIISIIIAAALIGCQAMTCAVVREPRIDIAAEVVKAKPLAFKKMLKTIAGNDQALWTSLIALLFNVGNVAFTAMSTTYVYFSFGYKGMLLTLIMVLFAVGGIIVNVSFTKLAAKFTRKQLLKLSMISIIIGYVTIGIFGNVLPILPGDNGYLLKFGVIAFLMFFVGFGQSLFYMITLISFANCVEYNEWKTGERNESVIFTLRPFMAQLGSGILQAVVAIVYLAVGVREYTNQIADIETDTSLGLLTDVQRTDGIEAVIKSVPSGRTTALLICMVAIPIVLLSAAYILYNKKIKLDEKFYNQMIKDIEERNAEKEI
jgi:melibiose permease/lactose/raffinose/galactose permease